MKKLWDYIDRQEWHIDKKYAVAFLIPAVLFGAAGLVIWLIVRNFALSGWDWMLCFIGYPAIVSMILVFIYGCNHEFTCGRTIA